MLLESFEFGVDTRSLHLVLGLLLGLVFGAAAQVSRFCLRRAVVADASERAAAGAVWLTALLTAFLAVTGLAGIGFIDLSGHRFMSNDVPAAAIVIGGLAFGAGMVLTRGCVSRLTVLSATGNLRALMVLVALAIAAHATMKGVLAPLRISLSAWSVDMPFGSVVSTGFGTTLLGALLTLATARLIWKARPGAIQLACGVLIGLVAMAGWAGTSVLLFDEFEPLPLQTASFTAPWADSLFWTIAATSIPAGFSVGFIAGVLGGSFLSAAARKELTLVSFESPEQTLRYFAGGAMMGVGGVLAGGCTVGAGLSGVATGSVAAILALGSIIAGAAVMNELLKNRRTAILPAE